MRRRRDLVRKARVVPHLAEREPCGTRLVNIVNTRSALLCHLDPAKMFHFYENAHLAQSKLWVVLGRAGRATKGEQRRVRGVLHSPGHPVVHLPALHRKTLHTKAPTSVAIQVGCCCCQSACERACQLVVAGHAWQPQLSIIFVSVLPRSPPVISMIAVF